MPSCSADDRGDHPYRFAEALAAFGDGFLVETGGSPRHVDPQVAGDPSDLLSWAALNELIASRRLEPPRLRLFANGRPLEESDYLLSRTTGGGDHYKEVDLRRLQHELRDGATLTINAIHQMHPPIREAAEALEAIVEERVHANLYAVWGEAPGFAAHRDDHDVVVLQLRGSKQWRMFGPTPGDSDECPPGLPDELSLDAGDLLYVPRGHWHEVRGFAGGISVHLTFGFTRRTGADYLVWLVDRLRDHEIVRRDIPRFAPEAARASYEADLWECVNARAGGDDLVAYLLDHVTGLPLRRRVSLPFGADGSIPTDGVVELLTPTAPRLCVHDGHCELTAGGRRFQFAIILKPMLENLIAARRQPVSVLLSNPDVPSDKAAVALGLLIAKGLVAVVGS